MEITVRRAGTGDAEAIALLSRQTFLDTFAGQNTAADMEKFMRGPFSRKNLEEEVRSGPDIFLIAESGQLAAGYAKLIHHVKNGTGQEGMEISRLYADKGFIGQGAGRLLMEECLETAARAGCTTVWLGVWEHNARAIAFYRKWGFEKFGEHPFTLGDDVQTDWLMKKSLQRPPAQDSRGWSFAN